MKKIEFFVNICLWAIAFCRYAVVLAQDKEVRVF